MVVVRPLLGVLPAEVHLGPPVLPQSRSFDVLESRNGVALSKVGRILPLAKGALVVALLDLRRLLAEVEGTAEEIKVRSYSSWYNGKL